MERPQLEQHLCPASLDLTSVASPKFGRPHSMRASAAFPFFRRRREKGARPASLRFFAFRAIARTMGIYSVERPQ